jgi:hypothetical protein
MPNDLYHLHYPSIVPVCKLQISNHLIYFLLMSNPRRWRGEGGEKEKGIRENNYKADLGNN